MKTLDFTDNDIALFMNLYNEAYQHAGDAHGKVEELRGDNLAQWAVIAALMSQGTSPDTLISNIEYIAETMITKLPESQLKRFENTIQTSIKLVKFFQREL